MRTLASLTQGYAPAALSVTIAAFLLIVGVGMASFYLADSSETAGVTDTSSFSPSDLGANSELLARLTDYSRSFENKAQASGAATGKLAPDVNTMIDRLAARLEVAPKDIEGWRMLGWSYFNLARYDEAVDAYAKAIELDPNSAALKLSYEEAKAKASEGDKLEAVSALRISEAEPTPPRERDDAEIRAMVDGLAHRLENSPKDLEGWTLLMRSRVVLGERPAAETAFRKAVELFKDDPAALADITATATALDLKTE
jgi:cytochrome c-type biogenesis protein CcmH